MAKNPPSNAWGRKPFTDEDRAKLGGRSFFDLTDEEKEAYFPSSTNLRRFPRAGEPGYEEFRARCSEAQKKGSAKRKARRRMSESLNQLLSCSVDKPLGPEDEEVLAFIEANELDPNQQTRVMIAQLLKAIKGDTEAAKFLRDTVGDKLADGVVVMSKPVSEMDDYDMKHLSNEDLKRLAESESDEEVTNE